MFRFECDLPNHSLIWEIKIHTHTLQILSSSNLFHHFTFQERIEFFIPKNLIESMDLLTKNQPEFSPYLTQDAKLISDIRILFFYILS